MTEGGSEKVKSIKELLSPRSASGAMASALLIHAAVYGIILLALHSGLGHQEPPASVDGTLDYQVLDEPPPPEKVVQQVRRSEDPVTPPEKTAVPDNSAKEMQDEQSTISGTQAAPKQVANTGSETNGNAIATPYYKIKPKYPRAALVEGAEGWVSLKIDIKEDGSVENVRVVDGEKRSLFESEARRAVEKWKYKPFVDANGKPFRKGDQQVLVSFTLKDATGG